MSDGTDNSKKAPASPITKFACAAFVFIAIAIGIVAGLLNGGLDRIMPQAAATEPSPTAAPVIITPTPVPATKAPIFELPWDNGIDPQPTNEWDIDDLPTRSCLPSSFSNIPGTSNPRCATGLRRDKNILSRLTRISAQNALTDKRTSQGKAYAFLLNYDPYLRGKCGINGLEERYALLVLYFSTNGDSWIKRSGWCSSQQHCAWEGVGCVGFGVSRIKLESNNLGGPIPRELFGLPRLKVLNLFANSISGEIPGTLRFLTSLQVVDLQHNILAGDAFPVSGLPTSLNSYKVGGNQLRGTIPAYIEDIKGLKELWIGDNQVTGALPSNLGNLLDLESLYVNDNRMGGALPSELARVASLRQLWLSNNQFDNTIPEGYWYLADLEVLRLGNNFFSGSISTWIGLMTNLQDLNVNNNRLAGNVPTQLGLLTDLVELHFGGNLWSGNVPNIYSNLRQLETFDISNSNMRGSIPNSLFNLANLETAYFTGSKVAGSIPRSFSNSRNLRVLHIDDCPGIEGTIPNVAPGKLTKLKEFLVQGTTLTGSMPSTICQLRTTNKLNTLEADCNSSGGLECSYPDCCTECYPLISF